MTPDVCNARMPKDNRRFPSVIKTERSLAPCSQNVLAEQFVIHNIALMGLTRGPVCPSSNDLHLAASRTTVARVPFRLRFADRRGGFTTFVQMQKFGLG
jgi:hypothetical protein